MRKGEDVPAAGEAFDSNCITPGTAFMGRLNEHLRFFVRKKLGEDAAWRRPRIVLSGHEVPGEGEHKIMEYIRLAKREPGYKPNVRHCMCASPASRECSPPASEELAGGRPWRGPAHDCLLTSDLSNGAWRQGQHAPLHAHPRLPTVLLAPDSDELVRGLSLAGAGMRLWTAQGSADSAQPGLVAPPYVYFRYKTYVRELRECCFCIER